MTTSRPRFKEGMAKNRIHHVPLKKFNTIEKEGGFLVVERRMGYKYGIAVSELEDKNRVLLSYLGMTAALEVVWKGFNPTLILVLPNEEQVLHGRCLKWFLSTDVYRTIFRVIIVTKSGKKEETPEKEINDEREEEVKNPTRRKSSDVETRLVKLIKCRSMFRSSGKKKWRIEKETENLGLNKRILEECYGNYIAGTPYTWMRDTWFESRASSDHNSFLNQKEEKHSMEEKRSDRESEIRISSDNYEKAAHTLLGVVKSLYVKLEDSKKIKTVNMQSDPNYSSMIEEPLMKLVNEVTAHDLPLDIAI